MRNFKARLALRSLGKALAKSAPINAGASYVLTIYDPPIRTGTEPVDVLAWHEALVARLEDMGY